MTQYAEYSFDVVLVPVLVIIRLLYYTDGYKVTLMEPAKNMGIETDLIGQIYLF